MNERDFLLRQAESYWVRGQPLPVDLFYRLLGAGIDVTEAERNYTATSSDKD